MDFKCIVLWLFFKVQSILFFSNSVEMSFCKEFNKNINTIDFGYQRIKDNSSEYYLSIANIFWRIHFLDKSDMNSEILLYLEDIDIDSPFNTRYQMAFCLNVNSESITGLVNKNEMRIEWFILEDLHGFFRNKVYLNSINFDFRDFKPSVAFVPNFGSNNDTFVQFLEQIYDRNNGEYMRDIRLFYVEDSLQNIYESIDTSESGDNSTSIQTAIQSLPKDMKIIAIFTQFSGYEHKESIDRNGLIIITQTENVINYCIFQLSSRNGSEGCNRNNLKTLIECSRYQRPEPTLPWSGTFKRTSTDKSGHRPKESSNSLVTILIILVLTFVPIIVLLIIGIILFIRYQKNKKKRTAKTEESSNTGTNTNENGNKSDTEKSEVITIFKREGWDSKDSDPKTE